MDKRSSSEMTGNADGAIVLRERPAPSEAYVAGAMPLEVKDRLSLLAPEDIALLKQLVPTGTADLGSVGFHDTGSPGKAILLLTGPLQHPVSLFQPARGVAIYLQKGDSFTVLPVDSPMSTRRILLEQDLQDTTYMVELATGAHQGGTAVEWRK